MVICEGEMDRVLALLRQKIRERGFTQLQVQEELSWGRSYISQLLTKQKALRVAQVLSILRVIGVDPGVFFAELYPPTRSSGERAISGRGAPPIPGTLRDRPGAAAEADFQPPGWSAADQRSLRELRALVQGLVGLLVDKELIDLDDLTSSVKESDAGRTPR